MLGGAIAFSIPLTLWLGRGMTFSVDELVWFMTSPGLDFEHALEPHNGHLILATRVVYWAALELLGSSYLTFQLLTIATTAALTILLFVYLSRRTGPLVALAPVVVILFFGSADAHHIIAGNGFTVLLAPTLGVAALLALERDEVNGDIAACALLVLGVVTFSSALPFVAGVAVWILLRGDRWRRAWVFAVPVVVWGAWFVWARGSGADPEGEIMLSNLLLVPSWAFQSLSAVLAAIVGLGYRFDGGGGSPATIGSVLALLAIGGLLWSLRRRPVPYALWATVAVLLTLWVMGALSADELRVPDDPRYLYPVAVAGLLVAGWAARDVRWSRGGLIALYAIAAIGLTTNLALMRDRAAELRSAYDTVRTELSLIELAGEQADGELDLSAAEASRPFQFPFLIVADQGESSTELLLEATERYGPLGFSPAELRARSEDRRARLDTFLVALLGIDLAPADAAADECLEIEPGPDHGPRFQLPAATEVVMQPRGEGGTVAVRRFADSTGVELGTIEAGEAARLALPDDEIAEGWQISGPGAPLLVCQADAPGG